MSGAPDSPDPERLAQLEAALTALRPIDRAVFLAARLDAMDYAEIAAKTGLSRRQVERCMARAVRAIGRSDCAKPQSFWRRWWRRFRRGS